MAAIYKIHPAIGLARVGNSPNEFYIAPESEGALPIACDVEGNPVLTNGSETPVAQFKDGNGRIKRQAARFQVYVYDGDNPDGREVQVNDKLQFTNKKTGQTMVGEVIDIQWQVYLANKKSSWYEFQETAGEHGYAADHPLRNAKISDTQARQKLIIDPGSRTVQYDLPKQRSAGFSRSAMGNIGSFPPATLLPNAIDTLGEVRATRTADGRNRLLVLGGYGNSGSMSTEFGEPMTQNYANNDGWFDDISDGSVNATIQYKIISIDGNPPPPGTKPGNAQVDDPAWVIVGYPRYAPQLTDIVTLNDLILDLSIRNFAFDPVIFGVPPYDAVNNSPKDQDALQWWKQNAQWNGNHYPYFRRDIWPILSRPFNYQWVMDFDATVGADPHQTAPGSGGMFDPEIIGVSPYNGEDPVLRESRRQQRQFIYAVLRQPGEENLLTKVTDTSRPNILYQAMPLLCGDNPLANTSPSKFLRLTDTQLFLLKQWADGKFINETQEGIAAPPYPRSKGARLDQGVLAAGLGGAFCPGGETSWIIRNPAIYKSAYRIRQSSSVTTGSLSQPEIVNPDTPANLANGLEPGDITKYSGVPWQADFNECSNQNIDVTYSNWNNLYLSSTGDPAPTQTWLTYWWPVHRPMYITTAGKNWSPTPQTNAGDTQMVTEWNKLGFVVYGGVVDGVDRGYVLVESDT